MGWLGAVQLLHAIFLIRAAFIIFKGGGIGWPAPPPLGGWSPQAEIFLIALGSTDALLIVLSLLFVFSFFSRKKENIQAGIGILAAFMTTALVFGIAIIFTGAFAMHPVFYICMTCLFIPIILLFLCFIRQVINSTQ